MSIMIILTMSIIIMEKSSSGTLSMSTMSYSTISNRRFHMASNIMKSSILIPITTMVATSMIMMTTGNMIKLTMLLTT